jgi:hypothetical protein
MVNVKLSKDFNFYNADQQIYLQVHNLFNKKNLVAFDDSNSDLMRHLRYSGEYTGPYDDLTVYGSPREIRAGFKLGF